MPFPPNFPTYIPKDKLADSQKIKEQLDKARSELEIAQRKGELAKAGELAYGVIPDLEKKLKEAESHEVQGGKGVKEEVTPEDIAAVVSRWTGVPVDKMLEGERAEDQCRRDMGDERRGGPGGEEPRVFTRIDHVGLVAASIAEA